MILMLDRLDVAGIIVHKQISAVEAGEASSADVAFPKTAARNLECMTLAFMNPATYSTRERLVELEVPQSWCSMPGTIAVSCCSPHLSRAPT